MLLEDQYIFKGFCRNGFVCLFPSVIFLSVRNKKFRFEEDQENYSDGETVQVCPSSSK
jgi:hypothetical protein